MSFTYETREGDTVESIARKFYGDDLLSYLIADSNPWLKDGMVSGLAVFVPDRPDLTPDLPGLKPDETGIIVNGKRFALWDTVTIIRTIDAMDTIEFTGPFEPDNEQFREVFQPLSYKPCSFFSKGKPLFTGTLIDVSPSTTDEKRTVSVSGYSLPGVLNDCMPPSSLYPRLEWQDSYLPDIISPLIQPFGLGLLIEDDVGAPLEDFISLDPGFMILPFIVKLAKKRGLLVSSSPEGYLTLAKSVAPGNPVANLEEGQSSITGVEAFFEPQRYYSVVEGRTPALYGLDGLSSALRNPRLQGVFRPYIFAASDDADADVDAQVSAYFGRMFGNALSYRVTLPSWTDPNGDIWKPNTTIKLKAPGVMIYDSYEFTIRQVTLARAENGESVQLDLVIPEAFRGEVPERMPWES